jgi:hypothetical protein
MENTMKATKKIAVATSVFAFAAMLSLGWSEQGGLSLSVDKAQAQRLVVRPHVRYYVPYVPGLTNDWYAVRAYYAGGPWSGVQPNGVPYHWNGWADYAAQNGIGCEPGSLVKGGDGIYYACQ